MQRSSWVGLRSDDRAEMASGLSVNLSEESDAGNDFRPVPLSLEESRSTT